MLSIYLIPLVVEQRVGSVEYSDLPCLASGKNRTSIPMIWMISGAKALMLMATMTLPPITFQMRFHIREMVTVVYQKKSSA